MEGKRATVWDRGVIDDGGARLRSLSDRAPAVRASTWLLALLPACYSPDLTDAACLPCPEALCPGNFVCQRGRCVSPGPAMICPDMGGGTGGTATEIAILGADAPRLCSGQSVELDLTASGGRQPYRWSLLGPTRASCSALRGSCSVDGQRARGGGPKGDGCSDRRR